MNCSCSFQQINISAQSSSARVLRMASRDKFASEKTILDFEWCFKPVFVLARATMGIDLRRDMEGYWSIATFSFGFFMLVFTISVNCLSVIFTFRTITLKSFKEDGVHMTEANLFIIYITVINSCLENVSIYLLFFAHVLTGKWKSILIVLEQIGIDLTHLEEVFYRRCRRFSIMGVIVILVVRSELHKKDILIFFPKCFLELCIKLSFGNWLHLAIKFHSIYYCMLV